MAARTTSVDPLVMYVLLRKDLEWPIGAVINQACHLCTAVAWEAKTDSEAVEFMSEASAQMTNYTMGAKDTAELDKVAGRLRDAGLPFKLWVEQPENISVGLATWPRRKSVVEKCFKGVRRF